MREILPTDSAGVFGLARIVLSPDGASYAYHYLQFLSNLYLVRGLK